MPRILLDDFRYGMNDRESPRSFGRYMAGERYAGPMPMLKNVVRNAGVLEPRGGEQKLGTAAGGTVQGVCVVGRFKNDNRYSGATHLENVIAASEYGSVATIGRIAPNAGTITLEKYATLSNGNSRVHFVPLGNYTLAYASWINALGIRSGDSFLVEHFNDYTDVGGTWTLTNGSYNVRVSGTSFNYVTRRWQGKYAYLKRGSTWYGPNKIDSIGERYTDGTTITLAEGPNNWTSGAADSILILGGTPFETRKPTVAAGATAGSTGNLIGDYQWCYAYGTSDGFESDPSPWSSEISLSSKGAFVYPLPVNNYDNTARTLNSPIQGNIDRLHIYRKGGTLGTASARVATHYLYNRYNGTETKSFGGMSGALTVTATTINLKTGQAATFPARGVAAILQDSPNAGLVNEFVKYARVATGALRGCTRAYASTTATAAVDGQTVALASYYDNNADSSLTGDPVPTDHDVIYPNTIVHAALWGSRLAVVDSANTARIRFSSTDSWRYFRDSNQAAIYDIDDDYTGGYLDIGAVSEPIVALVVFRDVLLAFKRTCVYGISGFGVSKMRVDKLENIPGTNAPDAVLVADNYVFWVNGDSAWLWDGDSMLIDIGEPVRTTMRTISPSYAENCVSVYHDRCIWLFYPTGSSGNTNYICWDFRYQVPLSGTQILGPSPTVGDGLSVACVAASNRRKTKGVVYAGGGQYVRMILGTGDKPYLYNSGGGTVVVRTPDFAVDGGMAQAAPGRYFVQVYTDTGLGSANATITPRYDATNQTAVTGTMVAGIKRIFKAMPAHARAAYHGVEFKAQLSNMSSTVASGPKRSVERLAIDIGGARESRIG